MSEHDEDFYDEDEFEDEEFGDTFLSDEEDDYVNMITIPRMQFDIAELVEDYVKMLRKCKTTDEATSLMFEFYGQASILTIIDVEQQYIQERVANLEELMQQVKIK
jgi:GTP1/Obg family GTP-binding protein